MRAGAVLWGLLLFLLVGHVSMGTIPPPPKDPPPPVGRAEAQRQPPRPPMDPPPVTVADRSLAHLHPTMSHVLRLEPSVLTFRNSPICIPATSFIEISNPSGATDELQVLSITSDDPQFHPGVVKPIVLQPGARTSVRVVYLPRSVGQVEATLTISTSAGELFYPIEALAVKNPYGLHSFVKTKIPAGVVYSRPIVIHNPFQDVLRVRDVFTTESFLILEVPDGEEALLTEADQLLDGDARPVDMSQNRSEDMWAIPAQGAKEIFHLRFNADLPGAYAGYVHVKTDRESMVLPVELEVLEGGLHPTPKEFDFGILTSPKERRSVPISLMNLGVEPVALTGVSPDNPYDNITASFVQGIVIPPGESVKNVVELQYSGDVPGPVSGRVLLTTNHSNAGISVVEVFYSAYVLHGGVGYERGSVSFVVPNLNMSQSQLDSTARSLGLLGLGRETAAVRDVNFTNYFKVPLLLRTAEVEKCGSALQIEHFEPDTVAQPASRWPPIRFAFSAASAARELALPSICTLKIGTNVSTHHIPIHLHNGQLSVTMEPGAVRSGCVPPAFAARDVPMGSSFGVEPLPVADHRIPYVAATGVCVTKDGAPVATSSQKQAWRNAVVLNFGRLSGGETRSRRFNLTNLNPVPVNVSLQTSLSTARARDRSSTVMQRAGFRFVGQSLMPSAGIELREIFHEMLEQGTIQLEHGSMNAAMVSAAGSRSGSSKSRGGSSKSRSGTNDKKKRKSKKAEGAASKQGDRNLTPFAAHRDPSFRAMWGEGQLSIFPGHTAQFELGLQAEAESVKDMPSEMLKTEPALVVTSPVEQIPLVAMFEFVKGTLVPASSHLPLASNGSPTLLEAKSTFGGPVALHAIHSDRPTWISTQLSVTTLMPGRTLPLGTVAFTANIHARGAWDIVRKLADEMASGSHASSGHGDAAHSAAKALSRAIASLETEFQTSGVRLSVNESASLGNLRKQWANFEQLGLNRITSELVAVTDVNSRIPISQTEAFVKQPALVVPSGQTVELPMTLVGDVAEHYILVKNTHPRPLEAMLSSAPDDSSIQLDGHAQDPASAWWDLRLPAVNSGLGHAPNLEVISAGLAAAESAPSAAAASLLGTATAKVAQDHFHATMEAIPSSYRPRVFDLLDMETGEVARRRNSSRARTPFWSEGGVNMPTLQTSAAATAAAAVAAVADPESLPPFHLPRIAQTSVVISPGEVGRLGPILFRPPRGGAYSNTVYIRNNLTLLERVDIKASGGTGVAIARTPDGLQHDIDSIFTLKFSLNASHWASPSTRSTGATASTHARDGSADFQWPKAAKQVVQLENHGDMPLHITNIRVGERSCDATTPGFNLEGCAELPVVLGVRQAWRLKVAYETDCVSTNEVQSLNIMTSAGSFDAILQAVTPPQDMVACEQARLRSLRSPLLSGIRAVSILIGVVSVLWALRDVLTTLSAPSPDSTGGPQSEMDVTVADMRGAKSAPQAGADAGTVRALQNSRQHSAPTVKDKGRSRPTASSAGGTKQPGRSARASTSFQAEPLRAAVQTLKRQRKKARAQARANPGAKSTAPDRDDSSSIKSTKPSKKNEVPPSQTARTSSGAGSQQRKPDLMQRQQPSAASGENGRQMKQSPGDGHELRRAKSDPPKAGKLSAEQSKRKLAQNGTGPKSSGASQGLQSSGVRASKQKDKLAPVSQSVDVKGARSGARGGASHPQPQARQASSKNKMPEGNGSKAKPEKGGVEPPHASSRRPKAQPQGGTFSRVDMASHVSSKPATGPFPASGARTASPGREHWQGGQPTRRRTEDQAGQTHQPRLAQPPGMEDSSSLWDLDKPFGGPGIFPTGSPDFARANTLPAMSTDTSGSHERVPGSIIGGGVEISPTLHALSSPSLPASSVMDLSSLPSLSLLGTPPGSPSRQPNSVLGQPASVPLTEPDVFLSASLSAPAPSGQPSMDLHRGSSGSPAAAASTIPSGPRTTSLDHAPTEALPRGMLDAGAQPPLAASSTPGVDSEAAAGLFSSTFDLFAPPTSMVASDMNVDSLFASPAVLSSTTHAPAPPSTFGPFTQLDDIVPAAIVPPPATSNSLRKSRLANYVQPGMLSVESSDSIAQQDPGSPHVRARRGPMDTPTSGPPGVPSYHARIASDDFFGHGGFFGEAGSGGAEPLDEDPLEFSLEG